jgi:hypothetical protein
MTEDLHLYLNTRTRCLMAETWDLKVFLPQLTFRFLVSPGVISFCLG